MERIIKNSGFIFLCIIVFIFINKCGKRGYKEKSDISKDNNLRIENALPENEKKFFLKVEKTLSIDSNSIPDPQSVIFTDFERNEDGNIYLVDGRNVRVYVYDKHGKPKKQFLRKGNGPGEFPDYPKIQMTENFLWIKGDKKIGKFKKSGHFIKEIKLKNYYDSLIIIEDNFFAGTRESINKKRKGGFGEKMLGLYSMEFEKIKHKFLESEFAGRFFINMGNRYMPVYPDPGIVPDIVYSINTNLKTLIYSESNLYRVIVKNWENELITDFSLNSDSSIISEPDKLEILEEFGKIPGEIKKLILEKLPDKFALIQSISVLPNNNIIIKSLLSLTELNFDIFDPGGHFIKRFKIDFGFAPGLIKFYNGKLGILEDNEDTSIYHEYKITSYTEVFEVK